MELSLAIIEILKYLLPSIVVFVTAFYSIRSFIGSEQQRRRIELAITNHRVITTVRLQAYERIAMLLERIAPESLVFRIQKPKMTSGQLHAALLAAIRSEFEHNLSQQVYISPQLWALVKASRENIVKMINTCAAGTDAEKPAMFLSKEIFETYASIENPPIAEALELLKKEISSLF